MKKLFGLLIIGFFVLVVFTAWQSFQFLNTSPSRSSEVVVFEVKSGNGFYQIAKELNRKNLITSVNMFYVLAKFKDKINSIRVGEYELNRNMFPAEILTVVSSGKSRVYDITFQEGLNIFEMADELEKKGLGGRKKFLGYCHNPKLIQELLGFKAGSLEGYLFPETYKITKYTSELELIKLMHRRFKEVFSSMTDMVVRSRLNPREVVTLASIVEKETGSAEERSIVSSVFHNRLKKNMRLQTDPTTIYGLWLEKGERPFNLRKKHLQQKNSYNTYTFKGLPKGPISNPGKASLLAALHPKKTSYLYFVSRNDGTTVFSETYKKHQKAVDYYQVNRQSREGKSWRDLQKKKSK